MKRLIALMCAAIFSMFAGIEFTLPKTDEFYFNPATGEGDYFQIDVAAADVDYRSLYGQVRGFSASGAELCNTTQRQDTRERWDTLSTHAGSVPAEWNVLGLAGIYDPVLVPENATVEKTSNGYMKYTIVSDEDVNISAPAAGKINTSHFACNYGSYMEYVIELSDGGVFTITIEDAKCWYCCANKKAPEDGRYIAATSNSLKGKSMRAGDILCVGKKGTTVTIARTES